MRGRISAFIIIRGWNVVSADNVDITFIGPVSVAASDELDFDIVVQNMNNIALSDAELYIDYPDGTKQPGDMTQDQLHDQADLGTIAPGAGVRKSIRAVLFGKEHDVKEIQVTLKYSVPIPTRSLKNKRRTIFR